MRRVLPAAVASSGASQESAPLLQSQPEPMHTPRLAIQGGRDRVAARELDEPSALRWTAGGKAEFPCVFFVGGGGCRIMG